MAWKCVGRVRMSGPNQAQIKPEIIGTDALVIYALGVVKINGSPHQVSNFSLRTSESTRRHFSQEIPPHRHDTGHRSPNPNASLCANTFIIRHTIFNFRPRAAQNARNLEKYLLKAPRNTWAAVGNKLQSA
jgi:hypothetical protein